MRLTLSKILRSEIARLRRDESGVALMLTLSVVLLLYVLCAGVYAVGETTRQKIEIQNACDAAAYSAALVEADGLSRMAMVNRAMAWTYIQLTNLQIDYITYKWLELVVKRFEEDYSMCKNYTINGTKYSRTSIGRSACKECAGLKTEDGGFFCGIAGKGSGYVRMNGSSTPVPVSAIRETLGKTKVVGTDYPEYILQFKNNITQYNSLQLYIADRMNAAIGQTAMAVLRENLPRLSDGKLDGDVIGDFYGYCQGPTFFSPYQNIEVGEGALAGNMMSPLRNTELGERIFLTMADGEVHDDLAAYFGPSGSDDNRFGGLDQWFVRGYADETKADSNQVNRVVESEVRNSFNALGICRVYKNANRVGNEKLPAYRAHHKAFGMSDYKPSCVNTHFNCPDQCTQAPDSVALYADYEWCAGRYKYSCYRVYIPKVTDVHLHHFDSKFIESCNNASHRCTDCSSSHARSKYGNCWAKGKSLKIIEPVTGTELTSWPPVFDWYPGTIDPGWTVSYLTTALSVVNKPNGFSRIYGDDRAICNESTFEYYTGEVAMPWLLNDRYYAGGGSVVVGLARKQRNPWSIILSGLADRTDESGIYSAFNPVKDGYLVAFSSARAAHRFHPSPNAGAWGADVALAGEGEYETRYDAVCDDELKGGAGGRFNIKQSDSDFLKSRIGCVCKDESNQRRFARCWNLCETDWDAVLLPLKYSQVGVSSSWYDSLTGPDETVWEGDDAFDDATRNPFLMAAVDTVGATGTRTGKWSSFAEGGSDVSGAFLALPAPPRPREGAVGSPTADGRLDLNALIKRRIL